MTTPHDEQTETDELFNIIEKYMNELSEAVKYQPTYVAKATAAWTEAKAALEAWSRQQTARVLDKLLEQAEPYVLVDAKYNDVEIIGSDRAVPVAAIEALRVGLERQA